MNALIAFSLSQSIAGAEVCAPPAGNHLILRGSISARLRLRDRLISNCSRTSAAPHVQRQDNTMGISTEPEGVRNEYTRWPTSQPFSQAEGSCWKGSGWTEACAEGGKDAKGGDDEGRERNRDGAVRGETVHVHHRREYRAGRQAGGRGCKRRAPRAL